MLFFHFSRKIGPEMSVGDVQRSGDFSLQPSEEKIKQNTDNWPLLLKGWDKLNVRTSHFTPIPAGCSPLQVNKFYRFINPHAVGISNFRRLTLNISKLATSRPFVNIFHHRNFADEHKFRQWGSCDIFIFIPLKIFLA